MRRTVDAAAPRRILREIPPIAATLGGSCTPVAMRAVMASAPAAALPRHRAETAAMTVAESSPDEATEYQCVPAAAGAGAELAPDERFGHYVIRRLLGEGGMGRVYLAEQRQPVRRDVALKLIREQVASPLARAYFDVERQALAQMQHPAIAQVFDAGTTEGGHPYLVMEVVEGSPITAFCRDERLGVDARLALFARVCHGVQHAHQKGIIHRDLKPANVLVRRVDGVPMPKIIDFGIAIGGGADGVDVQTATRAGTAIYMSPEQAGQRSLDTRSDVYSLGVMLYEVLTGGDAGALSTAAHRSIRAPHQTLLAAIESNDGADDAADAGTLLQAARRLPAGLRAILRKALAPDRSDRYASASALADDLERYREHRPLRAMVHTRGYLARTLLRRHRLGIAVASLVLVALLGGIALALLGLARAQHSAELARTEAAKAEQIADFVRGILAGIDPDRAQGMDRSLMRLVLDSAAERAGRELATQPAVRSAIERTIADSYSSLGELATAGTHYAAAITAAEAAALPPAQRARLVMRAAENTTNEGHAQQALAQAQQAFEIVASLPADNRDRLDIEGRLAGIECEAGKLDDSRTRYLRVLEQQRSAFGEDDPDTQTSMQGLAITDSNLARFDEARSLYQSLIALFRTRYGDENSRTLNAINGLAIVDLEQKHFADAEHLLAPQLPTYERVFGKDHLMTLRLISNLGGAIRQQGRNEEARPYYERAYALSQKLLGAAHPSTVMAESNLSLLLRDAGQLDAAERLARAAAEHGDVAFANNPYGGIMHKEYATILLREQRYADAERELDRAWSILAEAKDYGPTHPRAQEIVDTYVELYGAWKKPQNEALWRARVVVPVADAAR